MRHEWGSTPIMGLGKLFVCAFEDGPTVLGLGMFLLLGLTHMNQNHGGLGCKRFPYDLPVCRKWKPFDHKSFYFKSHKFATSLSIR